MPSKYFIFLTKSMFQILILPRNMRALYTHNNEIYTHNKEIYTHNNENMGGYVHSSLVMYSREVKEHATYL